MFVVMPRVWPKMFIELCIPLSRSRYEPSNMLCACVSLDSIELCILHAIARSKYELSNMLSLSLSLFLSHVPFLYLQFIIMGHPLCLCLSLFSLISHIAYHCPGEFMLYQILSSLPSNHNTYECQGVGMRYQICSLSFSLSFSLS